MPSDAERRDSHLGLKVIAVVLALVVGWFVSDAVDTAAQTDPWGIGVLLAVVGGSGVGFYYWQDWRRDRAARNGRSLPTPDRSWIVPVVIVGVFAVLGLSGGLSARDNYVRPYCLYGSKSQAQLDGCMSHVTSDDINGLETQAARFARGETSDCLNDSGPFCKDAANWNAAERPPDQFAP